MCGEIKPKHQRRFYAQNKISGKTVDNIIFYLELGGAPVSHGETSPERSKMRWELDETTMDSCKQIYHGVENDEGCLLVVVVGVGTRRFDRKSSSEVRRNASCRCRTSARGERSYERRLTIRVVLLKPGRRGLRRHIYNHRVWKLFGFS
jgi:hypothetical protein